MLAVSALVSIPAMDMAVIGALVGLIGLGGLGYATYTIRGMMVADKFYTATPLDRFCFGYLPALLTAGLVVGGIAIVFLPAAAAGIVGLVTLALLLAAIRNAWDVAVFAVRIGRSRRSGDS